MTDQAKPTLVHDSIRPSRAGFPGEVAFLSAWQSLMVGAPADGSDPLLEAHSDRWDGSPAPDQADATVAATLVQWLGTNAGACLIQQARALESGGLTGPEAYRAAWAVRNARKRWINSGLRTIERLMIPQDAEIGFDGEPYEAPVLTVRQYETAEHVCAWLGTEAGKAFVTAREREMEAFGEHERMRQREANRTGSPHPRSLGPEAVHDYLRTLRKAVSAAVGVRGAA